jgi:hypothetical protein
MALILDHLAAADHVGQHRFEEFSNATRSTTFRGPGNHEEGNDGCANQNEGVLGSCLSGVAVHGRAFVQHGCSFRWLREVSNDRRQLTREQRKNGQQDVRRQDASDEWQREANRQRSHPYFCVPTALCVCIGSNSIKECARGKPITFGINQRINERLSSQAECLAVCGERINESITTPYIVCHLPRSLPDA